MRYCFPWCCVGDAVTVTATVTAVAVAVASLLPLRSMRGTWGMEGTDRYLSGYGIGAATDVLTSTQYRVPVLACLRVAIGQGAHQAEDIMRGVLILISTATQ